jgi:hypothetical protein
MQHINTPLDQHWAWIAGRAAGAIRVGRPSAAQKLARLRSRAKTLPAQSDHGNPIDQLAQVGSFAESIAEAENLQR